MSDFSKTLIQLLSHMIITAVRDGEECDDQTIYNMATMLDTAIGGRTETTTESEKKVSDKAEKYMPGNVPVGKCPFILTRAPNTGKCCSLNVKEGTGFCTRHGKTVSENEGKEPTKTTKIVKTTAQSSVEVAKPDFKFSAGGARNFKPMAAKAPVSESNKAPAKIGIFTAKANAKVPSLFAKKKANFYTRTFQSQEDNGDMSEMTFYFTDDPLAKNMIFVDESGTRTVVGFIDEEMNIDEKDDPLPEDFMDHVNGEIQDLISEEQLEWCTKNKIAISA